MNSLGLSFCHESLTPFTVVIIIIIIIYDHTQAHTHQHRTDYILSSIASKWPNHLVCNECFFRWRTIVPFRLFVRLCERVRVTAVEAVFIFYFIYIYIYIYTIQHVCVCTMFVPLKMWIKGEVCLTFGVIATAIRYRRITAKRGRALLVANGDCKWFENGTDTSRRRCQDQCWLLASICLNSTHTISYTHFDSFSLLFLSSPH